MLSPRHLASLLLCLGLTLSKPSIAAPATEQPGERYQQAWSAYLENDYARALELTKPLVDQGNPPGQFLLGTMLFRGQGIEANKSAGFELLRESAQQGYSHAQLAVAAIFHRGLINGEPDLLSAMPWYSQAAKQGLPQAQTMLGIQYYRGEVLPKSLDLARESLLEAAMQNYDPALLALAHVNMDTDPVRACSWLIVMHKSGNPHLNRYADELMPQVLPQLTTQQIDKAQDMAKQWMNHRGN